MNVIIDALIHKASMPISLFIVFASVLAALMYGRHRFRYAGAFTLSAPCWLRRCWIPAQTWQCLPC